MLFLRVFPVAGIAAVIWLTWRWSVRAQTAAVILASTWLAPVCWMFRFPVVLIAVATWYRGRVSTLPAAAPGA